MPAQNSPNKQTPRLDKVFAIFDYQDGPRSGIANFHGAPYFFDCIFDEKRDRYSDVFLLIPLEPQVFEAAMENWRIFLRWRASFDAGKVNRDTHPALPEDRVKYEETQSIVNQAVSAGREKASCLTGHFDPAGDSIPRDVLTPWQVGWSEATA
jgi:hypothetical protein